MFVNRRKVWIVILVVLLAASACGGPRRSIIGKWDQVGGGETLEFYTDGTVVATGVGMTISGTYTFIDDEHIRIDLSGLWGIAGPQVFRVSISGNRMVLEDSYGSTFEYTRVK